MEFAKKSLYVGLGLASMTKGKLDELGKEFAKKAKLSEDEGQKLAEYLQSEGKKARESLSETVDGMVEGAMKRMNCVKKLEELEARIEALEKAAGIEAPAPKAEEDEPEAPAEDGDGND